MLNLSQFTRLSWGKIWFERFDLCTNFDILQLCICIFIWIYIHICICSHCCICINCIVIHLFYCIIFVFVFVFVFFIFPDWRVDVGLASCIAHTFEPIDPLMCCICVLCICIWICLCIFNFHFQGRQLRGSHCWANRPANPSLNQSCCLQLPVGNKGSMLQL